MCQFRPEALHIERVLNTCVRQLLASTRLLSPTSLRIKCCTAVQYQMAWYTNMYIMQNYDSYVVLMYLYSTFLTAMKELRPLPEGCEQRTDDWGRIYYVDHNARTTHWLVRPDLSATPLEKSPLPPAYDDSHQSPLHLYTTSLASTTQVSPFPQWQSHSLVSESQSQLSQPQYYVPASSTGTVMMGGGSVSPGNTVSVGVNAAPANSNIPVSTPGVPAVASMPPPLATQSAETMYANGATCADFDTMDASVKPPVVKYYSPLAAAGFCC